MRDNAIGPEKPKELSKSPWKCKVKKRAKESKWARDTQEKTNGTQEPASDVIKEPKAVLGHYKKNKRQTQRCPAQLRQITSQ